MKELLYKNVKMTVEQELKYSRKIKAMKTADLIILATLTSLLIGDRFTQKTYHILQELDERGVL